MRKLLVVVSLITLPFPAVLSAQEVRTIPPPKPKVVSEAPKKPLLKRLFGEKKEAAPAPAPGATPAPAPKPVAEATPKPKPKPRAKTQAESKPSSSKKTASKKPARNSRTSTAEKKEEEKKEEETATEPQKPSETIKPPKEVAAANKGPKKPATEKTSTEGLDDAEKYKTVKATALTDPTIQDLKTKADGAINESEAHAASVAYNRALFRKIREIEPSLDGYVDKLEAAMMKRLSGEKNGE